MLLLDIPVDVVEEGWWNKSLHASLLPLSKRYRWVKKVSV